MTDLPDLTAPLSEDELQELDVILEDETVLGYEGAWGFLTAVCVAPSMIHPSTWIPALLKPSFKPDDATMLRTMGLLLRYFNELNADALARHPTVPTEEMEGACESFADGFVEGALLDPHWKSDPDRWKLCEPFAFLCGRLEDVSEESLAMLDSMPRQALLGSFDQLVLAALDAFMPLRGALPELVASSGPRVRRNDPCPCGSGKKYKKCCMDRDRERMRRS